MLDASIVRIAQGDDAPLPTTLTGRRYQIFISSTFLDLEKERGEVQRAVLELGCIPAGMELFPASDARAWELIERVIASSSYHILIIGGRYGSINESGISYTEQEYKCAIQQNIPVLAFLHRDPRDLPFKYNEAEPALRQRLIAFRETIEANHHCKYWTNATELGRVVTSSLAAAFESTPRAGWLREDVPSSQRDRKRAAEDRRRRWLIRSLTAGVVALAAACFVGWYVLSDEIQDRKKEYEDNLESRDIEIEILTSENARLLWQAEESKEEYEDKDRAVKEAGDRILKLAEAMQENSPLLTHVAKAPDGVIIEVSEDHVYATVNLTVKDRLQIGMPFVVYRRESHILAPMGRELPPSKCIVRVVRVGEEHSQVQVVACEADAISKGDVLVNPLYVPGAVLRIATVGLFDLDLNGVATEEESAWLKVQLHQWGCAVIDDPDATVDFLIAGSIAELPPVPDVGASIAAIDAFVQAKNRRDFDENRLRKAIQSWTPVLTPTRARSVMGDLLGGEYTTDGHIANPIGSGDHSDR